MNDNDLLEHWTELFIAYLDGQQTEEQAEEFEQLTRDPYFKTLKEQLDDREYLARRIGEHEHFGNRAAFERFRKAAGLQKPAAKTGRWLYAATAGAAAVALAVGATLFFRPQTARTPGHTVEMAQAIFPAPDKVLLTLSDGQEVILDEKIDKQIEGMGHLSYGEEGVKYESEQKTPSAAEALQYNELTVPEGSKCLVTLEDGTRVWLNSRSKLRYPVKFNGEERRVELIGEGLFDVTHNPEWPFIVTSPKSALKVRGTKFNVRDFADEGITSTTLLEGCVEVGNQSDTVTLRPNMQAQARGRDGGMTIREIDASVYAAWTEDKIAFYRADLEEVMADIRRWYRIDTDLSAVNPSDYALTGKIPREFSLMEVIELLEAITDLRFDMPDEKTLIVNKR